MRGNGGRHSSVVWQRYGFSAAINVDIFCPLICAAQSGGNR